MYSYNFRKSKLREAKRICEEAGYIVDALFEDISEQTRLKKIESLTQKIEKTEIQIQQAQKRIDDVDLKLDKKVLTPVCKVLGVSKDFIKSKLEDCSNIENDPDLLKLFYDKTDFKKYFSFQDLLDDADADISELDFMKSDYVLGRPIQYDNVKHVFMIYMSYNFEKLKKAYDILYLFCIYDKDKYDKNVLNLDLNKKKSQLEELRSELEHYKNLETKETRVRNSVKNNTFATSEAQDYIASIVEKTVENHYVNGIEFLKRTIKNLKEEYNKFDLSEIFDLVKIEDPNNRLKYIDDYRFDVLNSAKYGICLEVVSGGLVVLKLPLNKVENKHLKDFIYALNSYTEALNDFRQFENYLGTPEKRHKYASGLTLELLQRVYKVAGTVYDASDLEINQKGGIDGIVKGEICDAKVNTVKAGGYNIQQLHYRTLVSKL